MLVNVNRCQICSIESKFLNCPLFSKIRFYVLTHILLSVDDSTFPHLITCNRPGLPTVAIAASRPLSHSWLDQWWSLQSARAQSVTSASAARRTVDQLLPVRISLARSGRRRIATIAKRPPSPSGARISDIDRFRGSNSFWFPETIEHLLS